VNPTRWLILAGILVAVVGGVAFGFRRNTPKPSGGARITPTPAQSFGALSSLTKEAASRDASGADTSTGTVVPSVIVDRPVAVRSVQFHYAGSVTVPDLPVLKRTKSLSGSSVAQLLSGQQFGSLNLAKFTNLAADSLQLTEQQEGGFTLNVDFRESMVSVSKAFREAAKPVADTVRALTASDLPSDDRVVAAANAFLDRLGVARSGYGTPEVRKDWLVYATAVKSATGAEAPASFPAPAELTVVYPWVVNNFPVYDESGNRYGLTVSVNPASLEVQSVYNLTPLTFESSKYELETDTARILEVVKNGGSVYPVPAGEGTTTLTVELGQPEAVYLVSRYQLGEGTEDFLVPALRFPIPKQPEDQPLYRTAIIVPVVKELLKAPEVEPVPEPLPLPDVEGGLGSSGSAGSSSGSAGVTPDSGPNY
jgi:hypothetical protein